MRLLIFLIWIALLPSLALAQKENEHFSFFKGKLQIPVDRYERIDTNSFDCLMQRIQSYGITFYSTKPIKVAAVYEGKVVAKSIIDSSYLLITRYGPYYMVYSGIEKTTFQKGDSVHTGQFIGNGYKMDNEYSADFFMMNGSRMIPISELFDWSSLKNAKPTTLELKARLLDGPYSTVHCGNIAFAYAYEFEVIESNVDSLNKKKIVVIQPCPEFLGKGFFITSSIYKITIGKRDETSEVIVNKYWKQNLPTFWAEDITKILSCSNETLLKQINL